jgi:hypothetical protein
MEFRMDRRRADPTRIGDQILPAMVTLQELPWARSRRFKLARATRSAEAEVEHLTSRIPLLYSNHHA